MVSGRTKQWPKSPVTLPGSEPWFGVVIPAFQQDILPGWRWWRRPTSQVPRSIPFPYFGEQRLLSDASQLTKHSLAVPHLPQHQGEAVHIGFGPIHVAACYFRCHVKRGPAHGSGDALDWFRQPNIRNLDAPFFDLIRKSRNNSSSINAVTQYHYAIIVTLP